MNEEGDTPTVDEVDQSASMASLSEEIAPRTDNKKNVFQRLIEGMKTKDKMATESEEDLVAQLTEERDRYKNESHSKDARINEIEEQIKSISAELENLKVTHANAEVEWKCRIDKMKCDANSKANEIECLQKLESEWKTQIAQLKEEVEAAKNSENLKISEDVARGFEKMEQNLRSLLDRPTETIRWRFTEISKLTETNVFSQPIEIAGITWIIALRKNYDHLGIYLEANTFGAAKSTCAVLADFKLHSQKENSIVNNRQSNEPFVYYEDLPGDTWGYDDFIPFEELLKGDAVKDDSIIVAVVVKVFPSH